MRYNRILMMIFALGLMLCTPKAIEAQQGTKTTNASKVVWSKTVIDSTLNPTCCDNLATSAVVSKYKPAVDALANPIATCPTGLDRGYPESPLSDWAVDVLYDYARNYLDTTGRKNLPLDFAVLNMGGIRTEMPKGSVSSLDIMAIFPFNNYLVILELPGSAVEQLMHFLAKTNIQAMSRVKIVSKGGELAECQIDGKPLDRNRTYYVATIDFLRDGGDKLVALSGYKSQVETGVKMMDIVLQSVKDIESAGRVIEKSMDGRAVTDKEYKKL